MMVAPQSSNRLAVACGPLVTALLFSFLLFPTVAGGQSNLPPCPISLRWDLWDHCQGTYTFDDGSTYVGEIKNGKADGQGIRIFANGDKYVGDYKDNTYNGHGTFTYANGEKYVGEFRDGYRNGQGTYTFPSGEKYVGGFRDSNRNGHGTYTFADGRKYVGGYKNNKMNGLGTFTYANGENYVGEFKDDNFVGKVTSKTTVAEQEVINMEKSGGVYAVPVRFNDTITLDAIVDSGAADVSVPADIFLTLMRTKTITQDDFLGQQIYRLADGSEVPSQQFRIQSLKVGNKTVENVVASIASVNATILLGQSFLSKFKSWSVDNEKHTLNLR